jgi:hypothetical protein
MHVAMDQARLWKNIWSWLRVLGKPTSNSPKKSISEKVANDRRATYGQIVYTMEKPNTNILGAKNTKGVDTTPNKKRKQ